MPIRGPDCMPFDIHEFVTEQQSELFLPAPFSPRLSWAQKRPCPPVWRWPRVMAPRVSGRCAIVDRNRFSPLTSVATGRNTGGVFWLVRVRAAEALDRSIVPPFLAPGPPCGPFRDAATAKME